MGIYPFIGRCVTTLRTTLLFLLSYCMPGARSGPDSGKSGPCIRGGVLARPDQSVSPMDIARMYQDAFIAKHVLIKILISNNFSPTRSLGSNTTTMELGGGRNVFRVDES